MATRHPLMLIAASSNKVFILSPLVTVDVHEVGHHQSLFKRLIDELSVPQPVTDCPNHLFSITRR